MFAKGIIRMYVNFLKIVFAISLLSSVSCGDDSCVVGDTRCNAQEVQICNTSKKWSTIDDCKIIASQSGGVWVCAPPVPETSLPAACLPVPESSDDASIDTTLEETEVLEIEEVSVSQLVCYDDAGDAGNCDASEDADVLEDMNFSKIDSGAD